jgi:gliding motility-associated-like protein
VQFTNSSSGTITSYNWNFGNGNTSTIADPIDTFLTAGTYSITLIVASSAGCSDTIINAITVHPNPDASFTTNTTCAGRSASFTDNSTGTGPFSYSWDLGNGGLSTQQHPMNIYSSEGSYSVELVITDANGCMDSSTQAIQIIAAPVASYTPAGGEFDVNEQISFSNSSTNSSTWSWNFGEGSSSAEQSPIFTFTSTGTFTVTLTSSNTSCTDTSAHTFVIKPSEEDTPLGLPTAFTPNGDGVNDVLYIRGGMFIETTSQIFTEWGNMIFESNDQKTGWDGTYKGAPQPNGKYIWVVKAKKANGEEINTQQEVTIIR